MRHMCNGWKSHGVEKKKVRGSAGDERGEKNGQFNGYWENTISEKKSWKIQMILNCTWIQI